MDLVGVNVRVLVKAKGKGYAFVLWRLDSSVVLHCSAILGVGIRVWVLEFKVMGQGLRIIGLRVRGLRVIEL